MTKEKKIYKIEDLIEKASTYITDIDKLDLIREAYLYAEECHKGEVRVDKSPFIQHLINTAVILTTIYADSETVVATLIHEVVEREDIKREELEEKFGEESVKLAYGVRKLSRINFATDNEYLIEYYKKIIVGMSEDVRVIIIKLADRLDKMRILWAYEEAKQKQIAKETLEILAPIAHHLGIHKIKGELEDLSLRYLKPDIFYDIAERLNNTKLERENAVTDMMNQVVALLNEHNINHKIKGRAKSIYSIYNKLDKGKKFSDIYDLYALRILVETEQECYLALGLIHSKYKPLPKRFKDYVAMPKPNGYQSLHTTVVGLDGFLFEIQIRTNAMDEVAENGVAAHWAYKQQKGADQVFQSTTEQKLQFFKTIMELNSEKLSNEDILNSLKDEVDDDRIYVYTPRGDIIELPRGATPIDFAYKVHSKVGDTMVGAIVNESIVPLNYELKNNDIVKINTSKNSSPSQEWLNIAKCAQTKSKIKAYFTKSSKEINIEHGKEALEKEVKKRKITLGEFFTDENEEIILKELKVADLEEVYLNIGNGKYSPTSIINIIYKPQEEEKTIKKPVFKETDADIIVAGIDKVKVSLANCCNPIPGDEIIGYITKGNGITVHRKNCPNLETLEDRTVAVEWNQKNNKKYITTILVHTNTKVNMLLDLMQKISMFDAHTDRVNTISRGDVTMYEIDVCIKDKTYLDKIIRDLEKRDYVINVERIIK